MPAKNVRKALAVRGGTASRAHVQAGFPGRPSRKTRTEASEKLGLRERKKARLRQQIIDTSIRLFRKRGYERTRIEDIVQILEISQPTFFRYFPSKDAVLREVGRRGFHCMKERLETELSSNATTAERLTRMYEGMAREVESDRPLWRAVVLSGAMDPVRSPEMRRAEQVACALLAEILKEGQNRGEIGKKFPLTYLAQFMEGLYRTIVRGWSVDFSGPHSLRERVRSAVDFFLEAARP
jgi:AcrR family transcriptional regulator